MDEKKDLSHIMEEVTARILKRTRDEVLAARPLQLHPHQQQQAPLSRLQLRNQEVSSGSFRQQGRLFLDSCTPPKFSNRFPKDCKKVPRNEQSGKLMVVLRPCG